MTQPTLVIDMTSHKNVDVITAVGRIDSSNANQFDDALKQLIDDGRNNIVLNMSEIQYLSSAGLRAMVSALRECKKRRGDVRIAAPSDRVLEVLDLAGLTPLFETFPDNEFAVGSF